MRSSAHRQSGHMTRFLGILCGCLLLAGCGFALKGSRSLPPEMAVVYLDYRANRFETIQSRLEEVLRVQLKRRGAKVVGSPAAAPAHLKVHSLSERLQVLSVGQTGKAIEYEIETTVVFDYSVDGQLRVPRQSLTALREFSFDETRVLAKEAERRQLQREMQEELAGLILLRIDAALRNPPPDLVPAAEPAG
jgi:LPS-assembly lipoprotein